MRTLDHGLDAESHHAPPDHSRWRSWRMTLAVVLAVVAGFGIGLLLDHDHPTAPMQGLASARVVAVLDDLYADYNRGDFDAFAAHFAKGAIYEQVSSEEPGVPLVGRQRIADGLQPAWAVGARYERAGVVIQNGDTASLPVSASKHPPGRLDVVQLDADLKIVHYWAHYGG